MASGNGLLETVLIVLKHRCCKIFSGDEYNAIMLFSLFLSLAANLCWEIFPVYLVYLIKKLIKSGSLSIQCAQQTKRSCKLSAEYLSETIGNLSLSPCLRSMFFSNVTLFSSWLATLESYTEMKFFLMKGVQEWKRHCSSENIGSVVFTLLTVPNTATMTLWL